MVAFVVKFEGKKKELTSTTPVEEKEQDNGLKRSNEECGRIRYDQFFYY